MLPTRFTSPFSDKSFLLVLSKSQFAPIPGSLRSYNLLCWCCFFFLSQHERSLSFSSLNRTSFLIFFSPFLASPPRCSYLSPPPRADVKVRPQPVLCSISFLLQDSSNGLRRLRTGQCLSPLDTRLPQTSAGRHSSPRVLYPPSRRQVSTSAPLILPTFFFNYTNAVSFSPHQPPPHPPFFHTGNTAQAVGCPSFSPFFRLQFLRFLKSFTPPSGRAPPPPSAFFFPLSILCFV